MEQTFRHWKIGEDTYAIQCPGYLPGPGRLPGWGYVICYLLVGRERALLQDTGYGNGDLKGYVETLTDKPLVVVNSHVHPDHSGGNKQFGEIWVLEGEVDSPEPVYFPQEGERARCALVDACPDYRFSFLRDGEILNLGGRQVQALRLEGHTRGSMVLLDFGTGFLFSGDAILKRVLLLAKLPLSRYRAALARTDALEFRDIYGSHWYEPLGRDYIQKMLRLIDGYRPEDTESAAWQEGADMVMFCHGNAFEEPDFCAIAYPSTDADWMKQ